MRKQLYWLGDAEWKRIEPLLPSGRRGAHRVDDRRVISGIMHMLRSGARWRDCRRNTAPTRRSTIASTVGAGRACGPRLARRAPRQSGDPTKPNAQASTRLRPQSLQEPQSHRTHVLPSQGFSTHRYALRQTRRYLPLHHPLGSRPDVVDQLSPDPRS
jgi:Putative transposase of IS4/5 family (DUF4096)